MKLSIIIPSLNEEHYLPLLLTSIRKQSLKDYEVIVADANSSDNTIAIAKQFGAKVTDGGMPARGRNCGARMAKGEFLFFLDADVVLPDDFLQRAYEEMRERYLELATCEVVPLSDLQIDRVLHSFSNLYIRLGQYTSPHAAGFCLLSSKRLFERVNGFNESLTLAEDHDYVKRASRYRPLRVLDSTRISVSVRRLEKEGRAVLINKYLQVELHRMFKGELTTDVIEYEFGNFQDRSSDSKSERLTAFEAQLRQLEEKLREFTVRHKTSLQASDITSSSNLMNSLRAQFEKAKVTLKEFFEDPSPESKPEQENKNDPD